MGVVEPIDMNCMGVVEPMGVVEQDQIAGVESPFFDVLSILCVLSSFVETRNGFVDPEKMSRVEENPSRE